MENSKILPQIKKIDALILTLLALIAAVLCLINYSNIDLEIQKHLFDSEAKTWLVDKDELVKKFIFYKFPKMLFGLAIVGCLVAAIAGFRANSKANFFAQNRHCFFLIFLGLSLIPLIAGNIKKFTNTYCPNQIEAFGGSKPYVKIFESYPANFYQTKKGQCFPAGHAVTGFALMILFFAFVKKSHRFFGLAAGLGLGWIMGFYQMAKGAHFFGDTLVSMLVCFLLAALIYKIYFNFLTSQNDQSKNH